MTDTSGNTTVAIFDLDGTITKNDTYVQFLLACLRNRPSRLIRASWLPVAVLVHLLGFRDNTWLKRVFLRSIAAGETKSAMNDLADSFARTIVRQHVRPGAIEAIERHRQSGHKLILATASLDTYANRIGEELGFDAVVSTHAEWDDRDRLTGDLRGENCYGQGKLDAVERLLPNRSGISVISYSDHPSDLPLLNWSDHGVFVGSTGRPPRKALAGQHETAVW